MVFSFGSGGAAYRYSTKTGAALISASGVTLHATLPEYFTSIRLHLSNANFYN